MNRNIFNSKTVTRTFLSISLLSTVLLQVKSSFAAPVNLAPGGTATASTAAFGSSVADGIDGNRDPDFNKGSVWHSSNSSESHWYEVDLGADYYLDRVLIFSRDRTPYWSDFHIIVRDSSSSIVYSNSFLAANNLYPNWGTSDLRGVRGQTVRIQSNGAPINTSMAEFEVWGQTEKSLHNHSLNSIVSGTPGGYSTTLYDLCDGDIDGFYTHPGYPLYHSNASGIGKTARFDFGMSVDIDHVNLYARSDMPQGARLQIDVLDDSGTSVYTTTNDLDGTDLNAPRYNLTLELNLSGRYLELTTLDDEFLVLAEVEVMSLDLPGIKGTDILIQPYPIITGAVIDTHTGQIGNLFKVPDASGGYTVRALGFYDHNSDGLAQSHKVGIWFTGDNASTGTLLGEVTIPAGTEAPLYFGCRWANLPVSIILNTQSVASAWYVVGASIESGVGDPRLNPSGGWRYNPVLQEGYTDRRWTSSLWSAFPNNSGQGGIYHSANLSIAEIPDEIPPPTGMIILIQ